MNAKQFLAEFRHIASAPNGVDQLRHLVLGLALAGHLLTDNESLPHDFTLLVEAAKQKYFDDLGKRAKPFLFGEPLIEEFRIPSGWRWVRVGEVCDLQTGATPSRHRPEYFRGDIRWLVSGDVNESDIYDCKGRISKEALGNSNCKILPSNSVLIALNGQGKTRATVAILRVPAACNQSLVGIIPFSQEILNSEYLYLSLNYRYYEIRDITGQKQRRGLNMGLVSQLSIPLPHITEQKRIVTKVGELMALCQKLEAQQQDRIALCKHTRKAALDNLTAAQNSQDLAVGWDRVRNSISLWLDDEDAVFELRNALGFLGCRGFLTESIPIDLLELNDDNFSLPVGWSWVTLRQLADYITSGSRGWRQFMAPQGDVFIRSQDIKHDSLIFEEKVFVALPDKTEGMRTLVRPGDLLMTITGANVGKCAQVPMLPHKAYVSQHVALVRVKDVRHTPFLHRWITNTFGGRKHLARFIYGDKPGLNLLQVGRIPIPLPPQEAQDRIVEALDYYTALCTQLAANVKDARILAKSLAISAVASVTGIRIEDKKKMKVPKTELVSTLRVGVSPMNEEQSPLATILTRNNGELSAKSLWNESGMEIDIFYQQLKTEMANNWIIQPEIAYMKEVEAS